MLNVLYCISSIQDITFMMFFWKFIEIVHVVTNPSSTKDTVEKNGNDNNQIRALPIRKAKEKLLGKNRNTSNEFW